MLLSQSDTTTRQRLLSCHRQTGYHPRQRYRTISGMSQSILNLETTQRFHHFRFAKIIYIDPEHGTAHVQWFEHSARTVMEEVSDSHELFMTEICDMVDLSTIVGKVTVHSWVNKSGRPPLKAEEYYYRLAGLVSVSCFSECAWFYRFHYDTHTACFRDPDSRHMALADDPPNNCPVCPLLAQRDRDEHGRQIHNGVSLHGIDYHVNDFVLYMSDHGPAHVGHILSVQHPRRPHRDSTILVTVQALGRVTSISSYPATKYRNEVCRFHPCLSIFRSDFANIVCHSESYFSLLNKSRFLSRH